MPVFVEPIEELANCRVLVMILVLGCLLPSEREALGVIDEPSPVAASTAVSNRPEAVDVVRD